MTQTIKTLVFAGVALASVAIAAGTYYANRPADLEAFTDVGTEFNPDFDNPNEATGLRVASYNPKTGKTDVFSVKFDKGLWRIPSHHNYPADGEDRLAKTAASMIGVERQALVTRSAAAQKRYNLLDPLDESVAGTEGRGDRITLYNGDETLVDMIVGKKMEGSENLYYVRAADEDRIYTADLGNLSLSTKFADWIDKDVLQVTRNDISKLLIQRYHVDEAQGRVVQDGNLELTRSEPDGTWTLKGLDPQKEELKTAEVSSMLSALENLAVVGVRPKPEDLSAGLKGDGPISIDPFTQADLQSKGFFISRNGEFISNEGEVIVGTKSGVRYRLGFGEEFSGTTMDVEIGGDNAKDGDKSQETAEDEQKQPDAKSDSEQKTADTDASSDSDEAEEDQESKDLQKSRYLFVMVQFDKELLGPAPQPPAKPEPPESEKSDKANTTDAQEKTADKEKPAEAQPAEASTEKAKEEQAADKSENKNPDAAKGDAQQAYQKALEDYELKMEVYEKQKEAYEKKIEEGKKLVADLNRRFADWYYVIPEESFDQLKLTRDALVGEAEPMAPAAGQSGTAPVTPMPPPEKPETPDAPDASATDQAKMPAKTGDEKSMPEKKPAESKDDTSAEKPDAKSESAKAKPTDAATDSKTSEKPAPQKAETKPPAEAASNGDSAAPKDTSEAKAQ